MVSTYAEMDDDGTTWNQDAVQVLMELLSTAYTQSSIYWESLDRNMEYYEKVMYEDV